MTLSDQLSADAALDLPSLTGGAVGIGIGMDVHVNLRRVVVEWRATARILADPELTAQLTRRLPDQDHGEVTAP
ncbi:hypothetical protein [Streptomyces guryensis]|uniref:Uncharacterized protein n=1 Tax=Streptomyces guryensis TaxID=2886947 RepID=A0A9Q3ZBN8_9ACTN|nr:hypothetical protein [Streptomyces guryensis]MCD9880529.1 hypothetical protein [Streptomyces guryensis]